MIATLNTPNACGYSVLINAPQWLTDQVESIRYEFAGEQNIVQKRPVTAQIPLVNLLSAESGASDEKVLQSVERIASMIHCFQVAYTGFSFFDAAEAFRINVEDQDSLISLRDLLQGELQPYQLLANTAKPEFVTAAFGENISGSGATHYEFTDWSSTNDFRVSSLSILKKVAGGDAWELLKEVPFGRA
ncbi:MAG: 2'-5' RNA ligase family protein [Roseivirga sp.]|nr:2'-5' RNA ligase family protein [Roseivirga sp.]